MVSAGMQPSKRRLTWPNGAIATTFSAEEPERLRRSPSMMRRSVTNCDPGLGLRCEPAACQQLAFQCGEEALAHGVVVGITDRSHGWAHAAPPDSWRSLRSARVPPIHYLDKPS